MPETRPSFTKPPLSVEQHISLLIERGLQISDKASAAHYITFIGYYRLSGYVRYYRQSLDSDMLRSGITFDQVLDVYVFDRKLRVLLADALERIEVAFKATFSNAGSLIDGPFWMCHPENFDYAAHSEVLSEIKDAIGPDPGKHHHLFLSHFFSKYSDSIPPCWMMMETLSFGAASRIYKRTKGHIRIPTAAAFGLQQDILESWLHSLVFVRNLCAHNSRVWNRSLTIRPKIPKQSPVKNLYFRQV
jgi:abortive infection bacteriophage resistance protein